MTQNINQTMNDYPEDEFKPMASAFSILPDAIVNDERLSDGEIILFARLMSLVKKEGYCWATNEYLSQKCRKSKKTISRYLTHLEECGHIKRDVVRNGNSEVVIRKIFIITFFSAPTNEDQSKDSNIANEEKIQTTQSENGEIDGQACGEVWTPAGGGMDTDENPLSPNMRRGMDTEVKENNIKEYITEYINNNSLHPNVREALLEFCAMRFEMEKGDKSKPFTVRAFKLIINRLNELAQDNETKVKILNNSIMNNWQGVFPLRGNYSEKGKETEGMRNGTYDAYFNSAISN